MTGLTSHGNTATALKPLTMNCQSRSVHLWSFCVQSKACMCCHTRLRPVANAKAHSIATLKWTSEGHCGHVPSGAFAWCDLRIAMPPHRPLGRLRVGASQVNRIVQTTIPAQSMKTWHALQCHATSPPCALSGHHGGALACGALPRGFSCGARAPSVVTANAAPFGAVPAGYVRLRGRPRSDEGTS